MFAALPLPLMVFAEPLGVALLTSGGDLARLSHQSRRARRRSLKTASYSCVKLPASGEVGVIWLRFRSALAVNFTYMAPFSECPRREFASVGDSAYVRESALTICSPRLTISNPGLAISYPLSSLYRPSNLHLSDSASIQEFH